MPTVRPKKATQIGVGETLGDAARRTVESSVQLGALARRRVRRATIAQESCDLGSSWSLGRSRSTANALEAVGLPPASAVPRLTRSAESLVALPLDPRTAFVAAQIDGATTVQNLLDLGSMPKHAALEALCRLVKLGVVVFG